MVSCFFPQNYLAEAVRYLGQEPDGTSVSDIKGIWVASDDSDVVNEVRALAGAYFPGVRSEDIVYADNGVPGGVPTSNRPTRSISQVLIYSRCLRGRRLIGKRVETIYRRSPAHHGATRFDTRQRLYSIAVRFILTLHREPSLCAGCSSSRVLSDDPSRQITHVPKTTAHVFSQSRNTSKPTCIEPKAREHTVPEQ